MSLGCLPCVHCGCPPVDHSYRSAMCLTPDGTTYYEADWSKDWSKEEPMPKSQIADQPAPLTLMEPILTLRDQFAMAAMQGDWALRDQKELEPLARKYYRMADAMLEARKQTAR